MKTIITTALIALSISSASAYQVTVCELAPLLGVTPSHKAEAIAFTEERILIFEKSGGSYVYPVYERHDYPNVPGAYDLYGKLGELAPEDTPIKDKIILTVLSEEHKLLNYSKELNFYRLDDCKDIPEHL